MAISQIDPHLLAGLEDGSEEEYDEEYEEGEEGDEEYDGEDDSGDEEYNMRQFGINQALPIPDGEPNWDGEGVQAACHSCVLKDIICSPPAQTWLL